MDSPRPEIVVNGEARRVPPDATLHSLVEDMGLSHRFLVAEVNGDPVAASEFLQRRIEAGDRIELVRPVAGG